MSIPDPFANFNGGLLHHIDITIAEAITGVRGRSISRHAVEPAVRAGARPDNAVAMLHWGMIGCAVAGLAVFFSRKQ